MKIFLNETDRPSSDTLYCKVNLNSPTASRAAHEVAQASRLRKSHRPSRLVLKKETAGNRDGRRYDGSRDGCPTRLPHEP